MTIDLLNIIRDDSAIKSGGFTGAIFLTYSLNLNFFEQIMIPALDSAGCANVLILADPDGYQQALEMGGDTITDIGRSYVCAPIQRNGQDLQHAKMLFMVGRERGRLLIGSGNLTYSGYGQNLELYSHFEYTTDSDSSDLEPFLKAWELIQKLASNSELSTVAQQQIRDIQENIGWLNTKNTRSDVVVLHNFDKSILEQLADWRKEHGFNEPVKRIRAISPYYDHSLAAIKKLADNLSPSQLQIYLDLNLTNLDGAKAKQEWHGKSPKLNAFAIGPGQEQATRRHVHAKAIIGQEINGSWCISGSANLSRPALLSGWSSGGNLELVTLFWSEDKNKFNYLFDNDQVQVWSIDLSSISVTETEPSEREMHFESGVNIVDLTLRTNRIEGKLSQLLPDGIHEAKLHLRRKNLHIPVQFKDDLTFHTFIDFQLDEAESARLETPNYKTSFHWIDQPDVLARFGARTYQVRIKGKIETLLGTGKLFEELMNFLWERVESDTEVEEDDPRKIRKHFPKVKSDSISNDPLPSGPEAFITDEKLVQSLKFGLEGHHPYDRSLYSLQDLFSIVLLRLTTATSAAAIDQDIPDEEVEEKTQAEREQQKINILERLGDYIIRYCRRYSNRLVDVEFLRKVSLKALFENHYTLGRILLEFSDKTQQYAVFDDTKLFECLWLIWAPLVWPELVNLKGEATLVILNNRLNKEQAQILEAWRVTRLSELVTTMFVEVLGRPPSWSVGIHDASAVETFMAAQEWVSRMKRTLSSDIFSLNNQDHMEEFGIRTLQDIFGQSEISKEGILLKMQTFSSIERYRPPIEEKYSLLFELSDLVKTNSDDKALKNKLITEINLRGLDKECSDFLSNPKPIIPIKDEDDDEIYCPRCGAELSENLQSDLERGRIVLCNYSKDAWIYLKSNIPKSLF